MQALGILCLENLEQGEGPVGSILNPDTFSIPTIPKVVPGAWVENLLSADDPELAESYVETARRLVAEGATAITTNCGFSIAYQEQITAAVSVPVATSSLMLMPELLEALDPGSKLGVVVYRASQFTNRHFRWAHVDPDDPRIVLVGLDKAQGLANVDEPEFVLDYALLEEEVVATISDTLSHHAEISSLLFECTALPPFSNRVKREFGLPVTDWVTFVSSLIGSGSQTGN